MLYPDQIPHLKMNIRPVYLPKGEPIGKGNIIFLFAPNRQKAYDVVNDNKNMLGKNHYRYFFHNLKYTGKINGRRYVINHLPERKEIKAEISSNTNLTGFPLMHPSMGSDNRNLFFNMSEFLEIFFSLTQSANAIRKMNFFWDYMKSIINNEGLNKYKNRMVLINLDHYKNIKGSLKDTMNNPVFILYYTLFRDYTLISDLDIDFLIYTGTSSIKINPSLCIKDSYRQFMTELKRMYQKVSVDTGDTFNEEKILKSEREDVVKSEVVKSLNFTGDSPVDEVVTEIPKKDPNKHAVDSDDIVDRLIDDKVKEASKNVDDVVEVKDKSTNDIATRAIKIDVENKVDEDPEVLAALYKLNQKKVVPKSAASTARDAKLKKEQEDLTVKNMSVKEIRKINASHVEIPTKDVSSSIKTTNPNMKQVKFSNFNQQYIDKVMPKDLTNAILALNDKSMPLYIRKITVEDTSNELNYVDTYTFELEADNRTRHTIKVDIPKFIDGKFMWLGGSKKLIINQNFLLPIVKTGPDTVQIVTNYNKMFIRRDEVKSLGSIEKLNKMLAGSDAFNKCFTRGSAFLTNKGYITTIEYDELSKYFTEYNNSKTGTHLYFDQSVAEEELRNKGSISVPANHMYIGDYNNKPVYIDTETQTTDDGMTIIDIIVGSASPEIQKSFSGTKSAKRLMYAKVKTMDKMVPVIVILCFWEGLSTILKKMNASYRLSNTYPKDLKPSENVIRFKDCYFIYQDNAVTSMMINGLRLMKTENYELAQMDTKEPYMEIFKKLYGKMGIASALDNTYEFTIDPITYEVLKDHNYPTNITDLMIYAVKLLADNQYTSEINQSVNRIRQAEIIPAILYDAIAKSYINYKNSGGRKKLSVPRDIVIRNLLKLKTVEDYSTLNPVYELERTHNISSMGWRGVNLDDSYTVEKRAYDPSMIGIIATSTSPDGSVGKTRTLTLEPNISSVRGYSNVTDKKDLKKLKDVNLFSPGELTMPMVATTDDSIRLGHAIKQSRQTVPIAKSSPVLISDGAEETVRYSLSTDFVVNAKQNGTVVEVDNDAKIMVVEYKDGTHQAVNLAPNIVKNGGGGFYESNIMTTDLKVGDKFKANDPIAWHKDFFEKNKLNGCRMTLGTLTKVALISTYNTHQDATFITEKLSRDAATEMCFQRQVVVGKNANISHMVKIGDHVGIGESLIQFDTSFEDDSINEFLKALGKDERLKDEIMESSKNNIKSKVAGVIEDIKIYAAVDVTEMSESLRKVVKDYYAAINKRKKLLNKYDPDGSIVKCGMLLTDSSNKVSPNAYGIIRGQKVEDGVLIEFYIKHTELLEVGSKIARRIIGDLKLL